VSVFPVFPLASLATTFDDGDWIESKDQSEDGIRLIQTGNVGEGEYLDKGQRARFISDETFARLRCTEIHEGDVLVSRLPDPVGRSCRLPQLDQRTITAVDCTIIRFDEKRILPEYFVYYSQSDAYLRTVDRLCTGATRRRISRTNLAAVEIPLPSLAEQKRIVAILDEAFEGIAKATANAKRNLANARELFDIYLDTSFGQMALAYPVSALEEVTHLITKGSSPNWQGIEYVETPGVLFVTSENVGSNQMLLNKRKYVEDRFNEKDRKSILRRDDVLTSIVGASIGRTAVFDCDDIANINQAVCLIRCDKEKLIPSYLSLLLNSGYFRRILHDNEVDNARANLSLVT
jgi:type I restriction enzyme, S subunit